jgi:hypothetical protein
MYAIRKFRFNTPPSIWASAWLELGGFVANAANLGLLVPKLHAYKSSLCGLLNAQLQGHKPSAFTVLNVCRRRVQAPFGGRTQRSAAVGGRIDDAAVCRPTLGKCAPLPMDCFVASLLAITGSLLARQNSRHISPLPYRRQNPLPFTVSGSHGI